MWESSALTSILESRRDEIVEIAREFHAISIAVFGSVARGDDTPESDIDFLVEFEDGSSLFDLMHLEDRLRALLGRPVDVVSRGSLLQRDHDIMRDAVILCADPIRSERATCWR